MATHVEMCKSAFKEKILPRFPEAGRRFSRYFEKGYGLIRLIPSPPEGADISLHPNHRKGTTTRRDYVKTFDMDLAFTILGLKPLYLSDSVEAANRLMIDLINKPIWVEAFSRIRLEVTRERNGILIYDPDSVAPILSRLLNREVEPREAMSALSEYNRTRRTYFSNELLGYPEMFVKDRMAGNFYISSEGFLNYPHIYYKSVHSFAVRSPESVLSDMETRAMAAALVEEIRGSPPAIYTAALLRYRNNGTEKEEGIAIRRTGGPSEWEFTPHHSEKKVYPLPRDRHLGS